MDTLTYDVLVLGLGNLLMSDDGFGVLVTQKMMRQSWPPEVAIRDVGTSAFYFLEEISRSRNIIVVDALRAGGKPGSVYRLRMFDPFSPPDGWRSAHGLTFPDIVSLAREITGYPTGLLIYGMEPYDLGLGNPLSPVLSKALPQVIRQITADINKLLSRP